MLLKNRTAIITGCNKGIGNEILKTFSENGADIFACVRNISDEFEVNIGKLTKKYNNKIIPIKFDLLDENIIKDAAKTILATNKPIDILINNAATIQTSLFQMTSIKKLKKIFEINFFQQSVFTQFVLKSMVKFKKGSIVYISSSASIDGNEGRSSYSASKAALNAQAKVLSREIGINNIRVNTIAPGLTDTDMMTDNTPKEIIDTTVSKISLKRIANPTEIANVALFLASDLSNYITGQIIRVDGGM